MGRLIGYRGGLVFRGLIFACSLAFLLGAPTALAAPSLPVQEPATSLDQIRAIVREMVEVKFAESARSVLQEAKKSVEAADRLLAAIRWISSGWLAVVSLIFAALVFLGWREVNLVRGARSGAEDLTNQARASATSATAAADRAKELEQELSDIVTRQREIEKASSQAVENVRRQAIEGVSGFIETLPRLERRGIVGQAPELPSPEEVARFEEADILIVMADRTQDVPKRDLFETFLRLGLYWRLVENFPRAIARFQRAIELEPTNPEAHRALALALHYLAAQPGTNTSVRDQLLSRAEAEVNAAIDVLGERPILLFDLGWISDVRGDLGKAEEFYRRAQALDSVEAVHEPNIAYNLACILARRGKLPEAFAEIEKIIDKDENWEDVLIDPELEPLRSHPELGKALRELAQTTRERMRRAPPDGERPRDDAS